VRRGRAGGGGVVNGRRRSAEWFRRSDLARIFGVPRAAVQGWIDRGLLRVGRAGGKVVARRSEVARFAVAAGRLEALARLPPYDWEYATRKGAVLARDRACVYCGRPLDVASVTVDHLVPRSRGGDDSEANLAAACKPCNRAKADRLPLEFILERLGYP
jgi:hypothetical protein